MDLTLIENKFFKENVLVTERFIDVTNIPLGILHRYCMSRGTSIDMQDNRVLMHLVTIEEVI